MAPDLLIAPSWGPLSYIQNVTLTYAPLGPRTGAAVQANFYIPAFTGLASAAAGVGGGKKGLQKAGLELRAALSKQHNSTGNPRILRILNLNLAFQVKMKIHWSREETKLFLFNGVLAWFLTLKYSDMESMCILLATGLGFTREVGEGGPAEFIPRCHSLLPQSETSPIQHQPNIWKCNHYISKGKDLCPPARWNFICFARKDMLKAKPKNKNSLAKISHQSWLFFKNSQDLSGKKKKMKRLWEDSALDNKPTWFHPAPWKLSS